MFFAPDAAFWSEPEQVYVSACNRTDNPDAWEAYVSGIQQCYGAFGAGHIVERADLDRQRCDLFWMFSNADGEVIGGVRVVGPVHRREDVDEIPVLADIRSSPSLEVVRNSLADLAPEGLIEGKGSWRTPDVRGLSRLIGRCLWHSGWWYSTRYITGSAGVPQVIGQYEASGGRVIPGVEPASDFPVPGHHTLPLIWDMTREGDLPHDFQQRLVIERSYLHPLRNRVRGEVGSGVEILVRPEPVADLETAGVGLKDLVPTMGSELELLPDSARVEAGSAEGNPWIHYPWRGEAVRVLDPAAFHALRTDRNRHKLTSDELRSLRTRKIGVIGLSVGSSIAYSLAQEGVCGQLRLADFDTLDLTNLNRLPASLLEVGQSKTSIAARRIAELDPFLDVRLYDGGVDRSNLTEFLSGLDLVIEECDSIDVKLLVRIVAAELGIPVVMETTDRGLLDIERFDLDRDRPPFHGLIGPLDPGELAELSTDEKAPYVLQIIDSDAMSTSLAASMVEIQRSVASWPQLASDVSLGTGLAVAAARNILLGRSHRSGRVRVDADGLLAELEDPARSAAGDVQHLPVLRHRPPLPDRFEDAIIEAAGLAPSGGNSQPWRFELTDRRFAVHSAGPRVGMDVAGRGTAVSCGAALFSAICLASVHHRLADADGVPDLAITPGDPDLMGSVALGDRHNPELAALADLIPSRFTNRRLDPAATPLTPAVVEALSQAAASLGARVRYLAAADLGDVPSCWAESDRLRFLDRRLHAEMFDEIRRPGIDRLDRGLDERTLELSSSDLAKLNVIRRPDVAAKLSEWDAGHRLGEPVVDRLRQSAGLLVITVEGSARPDYVQAGMAVQRLWLEAAGLGVGLQPVSPVFGYARTEAELQELLGPERGQRLAEVQAAAYRTIGIDPQESFVLALRAHLGPEPSAISGRVGVESVTGAAAVDLAGDLAGDLTPDLAPENPEKTAR